MSKNIHQIFQANPITSNASTDLMYFGQSPYGSGNDAAMTYANFAAQFGAPYTAAALTRTNDTNVTLTLGGTPNTALLQATSLTLGWTGTLSGTRGGTGVNNGASTITIGGNVTFSGASTFTGTLTGNTSVTFPTSGTLATTSQLPSGAALTETNDTNVTLTLGGSASTALVNAASITAGWSGQLAVGRGGTGVSSVTISPTASAFSGWDTNKNLSANNFISGYATTATAAGTTTLTVSSAGLQFFTGSTTQTVVLPVASTLVLGQSFYIVNNSTAAVTVQSSGGNTIKAMSASTTGIFTCILTSGTTAASWSFTYIGSGGISNDGLNASKQILWSDSTTGAKSSSNLTWDDSNQNFAALSGSTTTFTGVTSCAAIGTLNAFTGSASNSLSVGYNNANSGNLGWCIGFNCTLSGGQGFALGTKAHQQHTGSFVLTDSTGGTPPTDSASNQFVSSFAGGYSFYIGSTLAFSIDTNENVINSKGQADLSKTVSTPSSGGTVTLATTNRRTLINPSGTLATLTVNMPASPVDGQIQGFSFTQVITTLTVSGNGNTILGAPSSAAVGNSFTFIFDLATTTWYPTD